MKTNKNGAMAGETSKCEKLITYILKLKCADSVSERIKGKWDRNE